MDSSFGSFIIPLRTREGSDWLGDESVKRLREEIEILRNGAIRRGVWEGLPEVGCRRYFLKRTLQQTVFCSTISSDFVSTFV